MIWSFCLLNFFFSEPNFVWRRKNADLKRICLGFSRSFVMLVNVKQIPLIDWARYAEKSLHDIDFANLKKFK